MSASADRPRDQVTAGPAIDDLLDVDVIVASYRRPDMLANCLDSLVGQRFAPSRIIVVHRHDDVDTAASAMSERARPIDLVTVHASGVVAALTAGVAESTAPIVAFIDDDAQAAVDWLERIVTTFASDPSIGGVGGRDVIPGKAGPLTSDVGRRKWWGRLTGNHHLGTGPRRDVHVLKGVNMALRADALAMPAPGVLRGEGAERDWEVLICEWVRRSGRRLVYDPEIVVDHYSAPRMLGASRDRATQNDVREASFNSTASSTLLAPHLLPVRLAYAIAIGSRDQPGFIRAIVALVRSEPDIVGKLVPSILGNMQAATSVMRWWVRRATRCPVIPAVELREGKGPTPGA